MTQKLKNIDLINYCDAFPYPTTEPEEYATQLQALWKVVCDDAEGPVEIGYMLQHVYDKFVQLPSSLRGETRVDETAKTVHILGGLKTEAERTKKVAEITAHWRATKSFDALRGWRDEIWPVYGRKGELLFSVERSALGLFGCMRYGVHMTAYVSSPESPYGIKIWVPKRSATKPTYPSMLDNTVAGGLMTAEDPFECVIREADEEASLPDALVRNHTQKIGIMSYIYITDTRSGGEQGLIYPEVQWIYDLKLPEDVILVPKDGEAERFDLCTVDQVKQFLADGLFKPNCAVVTIDFFIRHGILTRENEPAFDEIVDRLHRIMPFPGPHRELGQPGQ
ncbi:uncharacterized protein E0L32_004886 [Thyridium curvatum]|uniref:Nudix hydrolase domain-containing protein n=1 Tax=Thyridium curvatum TaxID=1093900 RepID=A0A507B7E1_9PEZI|nr:uncharacterized protein E0L32_004886 [Thyridium curvatum]TPX15056.1 hypothetical protein E0L32_004886 [Thyridium curvatum]